MPLAALQSCLTELYGLEPGHCVDDFLITDRRLAQCFGGAQRERDEELLIVEDEDGAGVSLYLDPELIGRLERDNPLAALSHSNLADFLVALEGISHFTYFAFKAGKDECVSLLELELQAEVDKFITAAVLLTRQYERMPAQLHDWLFALPRLHDDLSAEETERYERANSYAARYCRRLWPSLVSDVSGDVLRRELRHFYRLPRQHKIGHIDAR